MVGLGACPIMVASDEKARRKGLMLGIEPRFTSLDNFKTIIMPTFNVGYEAIGKGTRARRAAGGPWRAQRACATALILMRP